MPTRWGLTLDCHDAALVAAFWETALGYREPPPPTGFSSWQDWFADQGVPEQEWNDGAFLADPDGLLPSLSILKVPESKIVKNRLHLDLQVGGGRSTPHQERWAKVEAEVARLVAAGASKDKIIFDDTGRPDHWVLKDPEGNEFCVV